MKLKECYQRLELSPDATITEIRQAYKRLVKNWHPDKFEADYPMKAYAEERIKIINAAYDFLCKHLSLKKTQLTSNKDNSSIQPSKNTTFWGNLLQKTTLFKRQLHYSPATIIGFFKNIFYLSGLSQAHTCQTGAVGYRKSQKPLKKKPEHFKASGLKVSGDHEKKPDKFKPIYDLRKHYGPRQKKDIGSISEAASLDKTQTIGSVRRVTPIRPVE
jgi:hypothetical protein